jgi:hypothetical protein
MPHMTKTMIFGVLAKVFGFVIHGLGRESIYIRNHMRNRTWTHPQSIPKNEHEQAELNIMNIFSA